MTETAPVDWVEQVGAPAFASIAEMVAALECDYDRLEELRIERRDLTDAVEEAMGEDGEEDAQAALEAWEADNHEELDELTTAAGECESEDDARERISEDPLSVEVRSGWVSPGAEMTPEEYCILLSTGGPATRIIGELRDGEPYSAHLEVQDWWKPWTEYVAADHDALLAYARCFCFEV